MAEEKTTANEKAEYAKPDADKVSKLERRLASKIKDPAKLKESLDKLSKLKDKHRSK